MCDETKEEKNLINSSEVVNNANSSQNVDNTVVDNPCPPAFSRGWNDPPPLSTQTAAPKAKPKLRGAHIPFDRKPDNSSSNSTQSPGRAPPLPSHPVDEELRNKTIANFQSLIQKTEDNDGVLSNCVTQLSQTWNNGAYSKEAQMRIHEMSEAIMKGDTLTVNGHHLLLLSTNGAHVKTWAALIRHFATKSP